MCDETLIRAVEAAALLHDMGKLAIPEYILNKPGKLTDSEFEKMKLHASVGADILSAIDFPYPVVPIVRHHHENWDGSGYPDGLKGTDIPIGARILSVVDCFDALTSDRPYRPRLSDVEAINVLRERRGSMYDPLIVDTFVSVYQTFRHDPAFPSRSRTLREASASTATRAASSKRLDDIAASADENLTIYELSQALAGRASLADSGDLVMRYLKRLIPFSVSVVYVYESGEGVLAVRHAFGESTSMLQGLTIPVGQRLSGWVAANRQAIMNSDPVLDLGEVARGAKPRLRSCLSVPLTLANDVLGVVTLYSSARDCFNENHRRILEPVGRQIAHTLGPMPDNEPLSVAGQGTRETEIGNPGRIAVEAGGNAISGAIALVFIDVMGPVQLHRDSGASIDNDVLSHVADRIRLALRCRIVFPHGTDGLVLLVDSEDHDGVCALVTRVREAIEGEPFPFDGEHPVVVRLSTATALPSQDSGSEGELVMVARARPKLPRRDSSSVH